MVTPLTMKGNTTITFNSVTMGGLRSVSIGQTQGTWDSTANDTTTARTHLGTWSDGTATFGGVWDPDDTGQKTLDDVSSSGLAATLLITFRTGDTYSASAICTEFSTEADHEGGWTFSASFQKSGDATWTAGA